MAERPVFVPRDLGSKLIDEVPVMFHWHAGMTPSQKKKNVSELHEKAARLGLSPLLEISSKSDYEIGKKLSAFNLKVMVDGREATLESVFQGSKVFERGGPYVDLYWKDSREAKSDSRLKTSGRLIGFKFLGTLYPLTPSTAFYDWLYVTALYPYRDWLTRLQQCAGFTDIEFNPEKSVNCQARSCATFVALQKRERLDKAVISFDAFKNEMLSAGI